MIQKKGQVDHLLTIQREIRLLIVLFVVATTVIAAILICQEKNPHEPFQSASASAEEDTEENVTIPPLWTNFLASETLDSLQKAQVCRNSYGDSGPKSVPYGFAPGSYGVYRLRVALGPEFGMEPCACESPFTCSQKNGWMSSINRDVCERSVALFNNATGASYECFPLCNSPQRFFFGSSDRSCSGCYEAAKGADFARVGLVPDTSNVPAHQC